MPTIEGSCLCGSMRYRSDAEPAGSFVCHCKHCQRQTGTAFSVVVAVPVEAFEVTGETLSHHQTTGEESGKAVYRHFCSACGSPLYSKIEIDPRHVYIKAGTLDDTSWLAPKHHIWTSRAQPWVPIADDAVRSERG